MLTVANAYILSYLTLLLNAELLSSPKDETPSSGIVQVRGRELNLKYVVNVTLLVGLVVWIYFISTLVF